MHSISQGCCLLVLAIISLAGFGSEVGAGNLAEAHRCGHASLDAYSNAVVSLKDPKSGMTFYVESNGRRLVALDRDGGIAWCIDVLEQIKPALGKPVIRHLRVDGAQLSATVGKSDVASIDVKSGTLRDAGRD